MLPFCQGGKSALKVASEKGHASVVDALLSYGADVDFQGDVCKLVIVVCLYETTG